MFQKCSYLLLVICFACLTSVSFSQDTKALPDTSTSDGLFQAARSAAFDNKNYPQAKVYCKKALEISPNYADIKIFLGRIYTWTSEYDSAKTLFESVLATNPTYTDASVAFADLLYWNDHYKEVIAVCDAGLKYDTGSNDLLLRKAKALASLKDYAAAAVITAAILKKDNNNAAARSLESRIKDESIKNKIGVSYDYNVFDKQFADPWHLLAIDYSRTTGIGTVIGRFNYANRFQTSATQFEVDAYPHFSKMFYSYMNFGISDNSGIFPRYRAGFSLYANLPKSFEAELGFRYLKFSGTPTWIYTGYVGKYVSSWLLGARTYITPSDFVKQVSVSYNISARHFFGGADDYIGANLGYGISPDDKYNVGLINTALLSSFKVGVDYKKKINYHNIFNASTAWFNQEYLPGVKGNQYLFSIGWQYRF
jgi:YaiO family outer membrane protein